MIKTIFRIGCLLPLGFIGIVFMLGIILAIFDNSEESIQTVSTNLQESGENEQEYKIIDGKKYKVERMPPRPQQNLVPKGYFELDKGIYGQWCGDNDPECPAPDYVRSGNVYWSLKVWCKEKACGDIYARVNFIERDSKIVRDWTNETAYGGQGQKVMLYFDTGLKGVAPEITEISFR